MQILPAQLSDKTAALRASGYFANLEPAVLEELAQGTSLRRYEAGEIVVWQGDACVGLYIVARGSVKLFKLSAKGRELIIRTFGEGATFNEVPVFDCGPNVVNVAALETSEIWQVEQSIIRRALSQHPGMAEEVIQNLAKNLRMLVGMVEELSFYQVTNRLARLISQLPPEQLEGAAAQRLTQDQLAARLGTVREVVARSLRELERGGAIKVERRTIRVVDREMLENWLIE